VSGPVWLRRLVEREPRAHARAAAMRRRIRRKARAMTPPEARAMLASFARRGSSTTQVAWVGAWSQSLDVCLRVALGRAVCR